MSCEQTLVLVALVSLHCDWRTLGAVQQTCRRLHSRFANEPSWLARLELPHRSVAEAAMALHRYHSRYALCGDCWHWKRGPEFTGQCELCTALLCSGCRERTVACSQCRRPMCHKCWALGSGSLCAECG